MDRGLPLVITSLLLLAAGIGLWLHESRRARRVAAFMARVKGE